MTFLRSASPPLLEPTPPPPELKSRFPPLSRLDIGWYGVLNGSVLAFISIYITRLGGSALQVGMINAIPGLITLLLALPAGQWLSNRTVSWNVFISSVLSRMFYLALVFIPVLFKPGEQVMLIILASLADDHSRNGHQCGLHRAFRRRHTPGLARLSFWHSEWAFCHHQRADPASEWMDTGYHAFPNRLPGCICDRYPGGRDEQCSPVSSSIAPCIQHQS